MTDAEIVSVVAALVTGLAMPSLVAWWHRR